MLDQEDRGSAEELLRDDYGAQRVGGGCSGLKVGLSGRVEIGGSGVVGMGMGRRRGGMNE